MFLATTALSEFWDKEKEILFLGEWCLRYDMRGDWEGLNLKIMDYPWDSPAAYNEAKDSCGKVYEDMLVGLAKSLNKIHGVNYSNRYWKIIIGPWLVHYIHALYDRYICIKTALELNPNLETLSLSQESFMTPIDLADFKLQSTGDLYNLQLYSQIIKLMGYSMPEKPYTIKSKKASERNQSSYKRIRPRVKELLKKYESVFNKIGGRISPVLMGQMYISKSDIFKICLKSRFKIWPLFPIELNISSSHIKKDVREELLNLPVVDNGNFFQKIVIQTLPRNFPIAYMEGYSTIRDSILRTFVGPSKAIVDSVGWFLNEPFKVLAAEKSESGTILLGVQHGGVWGIAQDVPGEEHEVSITDFFFSWGWKREGCEKVRPMPNPKISHLKRRSIHRKIPDNGPILHLSTIFPRYLELFRSVPMGPQVMNYLENQFAFIKSLPPKIRQMMIIRPHMKNIYGWQQCQRFNELFPNVKIDDYSKSFHERIEMCRLVVCSDNQTTFLESMAFNVPTLLFIDPAQWKIRADAAPYYQKLERVGILSWGPKKAALKVAEIYDDTTAWWSSNEIQSVREEFVNRFALGSDNWLRMWVNKLMSL